MLPGSWSIFAEKSLQEGQPRSLLRRDVWQWRLRAEFRERDQLVSLFLFPAPLQDAVRELTRVGLRPPEVVLAPLLVQRHDRGEDIAFLRLRGIHRQLMGALVGGNVVDQLLAYVEERATS